MTIKLTMLFFLVISGHICPGPGAWYRGLCLDLLFESRQCQASVWCGHSAWSGGIHHVGDLFSHDLWPYCLQCGRLNLLWYQDFSSFALDKIAFCQLIKIVTWLPTSFQSVNSFFIQNNEPSNIICIIMNHPISFA